ncbi:MAG: adenylate kinase [Thermoleophilia bacterium]|nr:adenylate kinase [Thermoleophilia bacterium]
MADGPPRRILVSGISAAGKSTLARRLSERLGLPYHELDALHHGPEWVKRSSFEADAAALAAGERWVTEDQYRSFIGELLWERAELVVWLDLPRVTVTRRAIVRTLGRLLTRRELWNGNRERWRDLPTAGHPIRWSWQQHASRRARTEWLVSRHPHVEVVRLRSPREVAAWISSVGR